MTGRTQVRLAAALWLVLAVVIWNVIFDRVLVVAGRRYVNDALAAANRGGPFLRIDDRMKPAVVRGVWLASGVATLVAVGGLAAVVVAARRERRRNR